MDAYDLIIGMFALNPRFSEGVSHHYLYHKIIDNASSPIVKGTSIRPHNIHNDSTKLHEAFYILIQRRVLTQWVPQNDLTWNFPLSPREYFDKRIKPELTTEELKDLEALARSIT